MPLTKIISIYIDTTASNPHPILMTSSIDNNNVYKELTLTSYALWTTDSSKLSPFYTLDMDLTRMNTISNNSRLTGAILLVGDQSSVNTFRVVSDVVSCNDYWRDRQVLQLYNASDTLVSNVRGVITFAITQ